MDRLVAVQILRAFAALSVARAHIDNDTAVLTAASAVKYANPWPLPLDAGVDLFFVISGFVMVHASQPLFGRPDAPRAFFTRRLARIVPIYWACTLLFVAAALVMPQLINGPGPDAAATLKSLLFIPYVNSASAMQPLLTLGWTLNYEMFFYAVFACCIWLPRRIAVMSCAAVMAGVILLGSVLQPAPGALYFWSGTIVIDFILGMIIAMARAEGVRLGVAARLALAAAGIALLMLAHAQPGGMDPALRWFQWGLPSALIVAGAALAEPPQEQSASLRFLTLLGDASYAMYLIHPFIIRPLRLLWQKTGWADVAGAFAFGIAALALVIAASVAVYVYFEKPLTRRLQAAFAPPRVTPA